MKKNNKTRILLVILVSITIVIFFPKISYSIDSLLVSRDKRPIFVIPVDQYKDGGTTIYQGINYQVIKWNMETTLVQPDGKTLSGIERGYEISMYPNYKNINDGPSKKLKFIRR